MESNNVQELLFEEIKTKLPEKDHLAEKLADFLCGSIDSAYRRISGKTALTFVEAAKLAEYFGINLNDFLEKDRGTISFERRSPLKSKNDIAIHLKEMTELMKIQLSNSSEPTIYTTRDIPVFYQFYFPELGAFKVYCWHRALNSSDQLNEPFDPKKIVNDYGNLFKEVHEMYSQLPSIEIWSEVSVLAFIRQLQYYYDSGLMGDKQTALLLCDQHKKVFELVKEQARIGQKLKTKTSEPKDKSYELYFNELFVMDNSAFAKLKDKQVFFNSFANFNYIPTNDNQFCSDVKLWLENQMKRSVKLSLSREKERNQFFTNINQEIDQLITYIESN